MKLLTDSPPEICIGLPLVFFSSATIPIWIKYFRIRVYTGVHVCVCHAMCNESAIRHLSVPTRHFQGCAGLAGEMATQGGEVDNEANGLAERKVEGWRCFLPDRDRDGREPFMEWLGGVTILSEDGMNLSMNHGFPV
jgi:hypothetical protein